MRISDDHGSVREHLTISGVGGGRLWAAMWEWLARPNRYRAVRSFGTAAASGDPARLTPLLDPAIAVVVDSGDEDHPAIRVVDGVYDAGALLLHGFAVKPGIQLVERPVNGQAGLILTRDGELSATVTVDFTGRLVSMVWIRLQPEKLRHWNRI